MSMPFLGEIATVPYNFAPRGWALCNGQLLPISQNTALFSLLGTRYGGNGQSNFALPDLNGSLAIGAGQGPGLSDRWVGESAGSSIVTLTSAEMPSHTHGVNAVAAGGSSGDPSGRVWAEPRLGRAVRPAYAPTADVAMAPDVISMSGGGQPHENMPPYLGLHFVIAMQGVYPARP
jgi:microcystin-dependent protein